MASAAHRVRVKLASGPSALAMVASRSVRRSSDILTGSERLLPAFLIVGAQRCGTTSLYQALSRHPAVIRSPLHREVHYFDNHYDRGLAWYRSHFPTRSRAERVRRTTGMDAVTFESSPFYLFHPLAIARIAEDLPDARLIVMVRDPIERAVSAHAHEVALGRETEPLERALELEPTRIAGEWQRMLADPTYTSVHLQHHAYVARGLYADQLDRAARFVARDQMLVIDAGDFFATPAPVYDRVLAFLGLEFTGYPTFARHNARATTTMPEHLRATLTERFEESDQRLAEWLGAVPSWRRGSSAIYPPLPSVHLDGAER